MTITQARTFATSLRSGGMPKIVLTLLIILFVAALFFLLFVSRSFDERVRAAFVDNGCPKTSPRTYPAGSYTGPLWDTHMHIGAIPDGPLGSPQPSLTNSFPMLGVNITVHDVVCAFITEGTEKVFMFFPVWDPRESMIEVARRATELYPGQFVPFIMPPEGDNDPGGYPTVDASTLESMLAIEPGLFQGYGEIGLYERDGGAAELPPDSERMLEIYPVLEKHGLLAYVHLGVEQQDNFARAAELFPNASFIFHGDQLVAGNRDHPDMSAIEELLFAHPNITYGIDELYGDVWLLRSDVTQEEFFAHFEEDESLLAYDLSVWGGFIERHPDQVIWGTDRGAQALWTMDLDVGLQLTDYARAFIGRLDSDVQEKFAYKNAMRLLESVTSENF